ncbi:MAG: hypothetical protein IJ833_00150 [Lachnospiraceae bacterium]|nr:hypothetical protein [Lachnospiraceae bacterium]
MKRKKTELWSLYGAGRDRRFWKLAMKNITVDSLKKQQALRMISQTAGEKRIISRPSLVHKIGVQIRYLEKGYFVFPVLLMSGALGIVNGMKQTGVREVELFTVLSAVIALLGIFGTISISRLFSNHMGELEASCFCSIGELVAIRMTLSAFINGVLLLACSIVMRGWIQMEFLRILLYILTPFLVSNCLYYAILLRMRDKNIILSFGATGILSGAVWSFFLRNSLVYARGAMAVWIGMAVCSGMILIGEIHWLLKGAEKGEMICYQWN